MKHEAKVLAGCVLLNSYTFDWDEFRMQFFDDWKIEITEEAEQFSFQFKIEDVSVACMLVPAVKPEVYGLGQNNYSWPGCEDAIKTHEGYVEVGIMDCEVPLRRHILYTMVASSMLKQSNVVGLYQYPTVHRPEDYISSAQVMLQEELPIQHWVYIGLYRGENDTWNSYTYGMENFDKEEMEIVGTQKDIFAIYRFMLNIITYVITNDDTLKPGESIGVSKDESYEISRSAGVAFDGETLKIAF